MLFAVGSSSSSCFGFGTSESHSALASTCNSNATHLTTRAHWHRRTSPSSRHRRECMSRRGRGCGSAGCRPYPPGHRTSGSSNLFHEREQQSAQMPLPPPTHTLPMPPAPCPPSPRLPTHLAPTRLLLLHHLLRELAPGRFGSARHRMPLDSRRIQNPSPASLGCRVVTCFGIFSRGRPRALPAPLPALLRGITWGPKFVRPYVEQLARGFHVPLC